MDECPFCHQLLHGTKEANNEHGMNCLDGPLASEKVSEKGIYAKHTFIDIAQY